MAIDTFSIGSAEDCWFSISSPSHAIVGQVHLSISITPIPADIPSSPAVDETLFDESILPTSIAAPQPPAPQPEPDEVNPDLIPEPTATAPPPPLPIASKPALD